MSEAAPFQLGMKVGGDARGLLQLPEQSVPLLLLQDPVRRCRSTSTSRIVPTQQRAGFSPLTGPLALGAVRPLQLLLQPAALLLQLLQRLRRVLLFAHQDDLLQECLLLTHQLQEVAVSVRLGSSRPALTVQLC